VLCISICANLNVKQKIFNHLCKKVCNQYAIKSVFQYFLKLIRYPKIPLLTTNTVQLSSKVTFAYVSDASHMCSGRAPVWQKRGVALTYVLLQLYHEVLRLHGRVARASQTRPACVSDEFGCYLGAELYCASTLLGMLPKAFEVAGNEA